MNSICPMNFFRTTDTTDTTIWKPGFERVGNWKTTVVTGLPLVTRSTTRKASRENNDFFFIYSCHFLAVYAKYYMKLLLRMFRDILCNVGMITFLINGELELNYMLILSRCCCISIYGHITLFWRHLSFC